MPNATNQASGPLIVSTTNPRYFAIKDETGKERAVYLTGSHIWNNFQDGLGPGQDAPEKPEQNDYTAYLSFLKEHNHNFIRLWRWEQFQSQAGGGTDVHMNMSPQPWSRTGPGVAKDDKPKFDLSEFNETYFQRLRDRVITAGKQGIYVDVMLFEGWGLHLSPAPDNIEGHPFFADNNINAIGIKSIVDYQVLPLAQSVQALQEAYLKKVIDTLHDLPNVLYEVANESSGGGKVDKEFAGYLNLSEVPEWGDSTEWQYWVIHFVKKYEQEKGYRHHPMGMTMQWPVREQIKVNEPLYSSNAEWVSPGFDDEIFAHGGHPMAPGSPPSRWYIDPPPAEGKKVVITDTDHYAPGKEDVLWAWKSFVRGHNPILMDFAITDLAHFNPSPYESDEAARYAMGDTLRFAQRMQLLETKPRGELSSTGYVLASPGKEYLILQPEAASPFTVKLEAGTYTLEWFSVTGRETQTGDTITVEEAHTIPFEPPFESDSTVLYLKTH